MISRLAPALTLTLSLALAAGACGGPTKGVAAPNGENATNTSVEGAIKLTAGTSVAVTIPCKGAAYFGPFDAPIAPAKLSIDSELRSTVAAQTCTIAEWVSPTGVVLAPLTPGTGCADEASGNLTRGSLDYEAAGPAKTFYLRVTVAERACQSAALSLTLN